MKRSRRARNGRADGFRCRRATSPRGHGPLAEERIPLEQAIHESSGVAFDLALGQRPQRDDLDPTRERLGANGFRTILDILMSA